MVVKSNYRILLLLLLVFSSCSISNPVKELIESDTSGFISRDYADQPPLADIINLPVYTSSETSFTLDKESDVQVYGVGELLYDFGSVTSDYYFLGDDLEFFFKGDTDRTEKKYIFSWSECQGKGGKYTLTQPDGSTMFGFFVEDSLKRKKYIAEVRFSRSSLGVKNLAAESSLLFELAVGDSDNRFVQEGKMALFSITDPLYTKNIPYGKIVLESQASRIKSHTVIPSTFGKPILDWDIRDDAWAKAPHFSLNKVVAGSIKDKYDLSVKAKSCFTQDSIYFLLEISDANQERIYKNKIAKEQTFLDYGWIEDTTGKRIWEMNALHSSFAGGALKNHRIDTVLKLPKGTYKVKYESDESHAYNNWDDLPPSIPFYGIIVYKKK